jgi:FkbM family methyltransferase
MEDALQHASEELSLLLKSTQGLVRGNIEEISFRPDGARVRLSPPTLPDDSGSPFTPIELVVDPNDFRDVPFTSLRDASYEPLISRLLLTFASTSRVFIDVGSNVGFYCALLAKSFPELIIHGVEPNPSLWNRWETNQEINALKGRCVLHKAGLAAIDEESTFYVPTMTGSGGGSRKLLHPEETQKEITVSMRTADSLELPRELSLVKIDVEGAEHDVVQALDTRLSESKPTIVIELLRKWMAPFNSHPQEVVKMLRSFGYKSFAVGTDAITQVGEINDQTHETNFLFVHKENKDHLAKSIPFLAQ